MICPQTKLEASLADAIEAQQVTGLMLAKADTNLMAAGKLRDVANRYYDESDCFSDLLDREMADALANVESVIWSAGIKSSESHSANTVGGPTPVMDAAPACERKE